MCEWDRQWRGNGTSGQLGINWVKFGLLCDFEEDSSSFLRISAIIYFSELKTTYFPWNWKFFFGQINLSPRHLVYFSQSSRHLISCSLFWERSRILYAGRGGVTWLTSLLAVRRRSVPPSPLFFSSTFAASYMESLSFQCSMMRCSSSYSSNSTSVDIIGERPNAFPGQS